MPFGMDKSLGGDSPENVKWMEGCVKAVKGQKGKDGKPMKEGTAIAICKATFRKHKEKMKKEQK